MEELRFIFIATTLLMGAVLTVYHFLVKPLYSERNDDEEETDADDDEDKSPMELLTDTLSDIGCLYKDNGKGGLFIEYQGEEFNVYVDEIHPVIWIYDIAWGVSDVNNPNAGRLKAAVNKANENSAVTNLYTINEERGQIAVHSQMMSYWDCHIPNRSEYFKYLLDGFITAHENVKNVFALSCRSDGSEGDMPAGRGRSRR